MRVHPSIYICLLCGWKGQPRELARDPDGTRLFFIIRTAYRYGVAYLDRKSVV